MQRDSSKAFIIQGPINAPPQPKCEGVEMFINSFDWEIDEAERAEFLFWLRASIILDMAVQHKAFIVRRLSNHFIQEEFLDKSRDGQK